MYVGHELRDQPGFDRETDPLRGTGDRALELLGCERDDELGARSQVFSEAGVRQRAVEDVRPERENDPQPAVRVRRRLTEHGEEARPVPSSARVKTSSNWSTTSSNRELSSGSNHSTASSSPAPSCRSLSSRSRGGGAGASGRNAAVSSAKGSEPGVVSAINQRSDPVRPPTRRAGTRPARTTEDLPLPEGPTSARSRAPSPSSASRCRRRRTSCSRPKKSDASGSRNGRSPLYGFRVGTWSATRDGVARNAAATAATNADTSGYRSAGSLLVARRIASSTSGERSGMRVLNDGSSSTGPRVAPASRGASHGRRPESISNRTSPRL